MGGIPTQVSRHNTPSRAHALTKVVQSEAKRGDNVAIIVSEHKHTHTHTLHCVIQELKLFLHAYTTHMTIRNILL